MMNWVHGSLRGDESLKRVAEAVAKAELRTQGEIVPMIVRSSSAIGHIPLMITALLSCVGLVILLPFYEFVADTKWIYGVPLAFFAIFGFSFVLARSQTIQRWLIPDFDEEIQVRRRAAAEFALAKISKQSQRKGVLLFASVMERKVVILPDEGLQADCPPETWNEVAGILAASLKRGAWAEGFEKAIEKCGEVLSKAAPGGEHRNELANSLIIKE